jgi:hypothetical protein
MSDLHAPQPRHHRRDVCLVSRPCSLPRATVVFLVFRVFLVLFHEEGLARKARKSPAKPGRGPAQSPARKPAVGPVGLSLGMALVHVRVPVRSRFLATGISPEHVPPLNARAQLRELRKIYSTTDLVDWP